MLRASHNHGPLGLPNDHDDDDELCGDTTPGRPFDIRTEIVMSVIGIGTSIDGPRVVAEFRYRNPVCQWAATGGGRQIANGIRERVSKMHRNVRGVFNSLA